MITLKVTKWVSFIDLFLLLLGKVLEFAMYFIRFLMDNKLIANEFDQSPCQ
jgi:hypothetical protein